MAVRLYNLTTVQYIEIEEWCDRNIVPLPIDHPCIAWTWSGYSPSDSVPASRRVTQFQFNRSADELMFSLRWA